MITAEETRTPSKSPAGHDLRLATPSSVKVNGWERFRTWVQEGGIVLLARRIPKGGGHHDDSARHPILAAAVSTQMVNQITKKGRAPRVHTETLPSAEARADFRGFCDRVYIAAADAQDVHYEIRSYKNAGTRASDNPDATWDPSFTLVSLDWLSEALGMERRDFYRVEEHLPWITPRRR